MASASSAAQPLAGSFESTQLLDLRLRSRWCSCQPLPVFDSAWSPRPVSVQADRLRLATSIPSGDAFSVCSCAWAMPLQWVRVFGVLHSRSSVGVCWRVRATPIPCVRVFGRSMPYQCVRVVGVLHSRSSVGVSFVACLRVQCRQKGILRLEFRPPQFAPPAFAFMVCLSAFRSQ